MFGGGWNPYMNLYVFYQDLVKMKEKQKLEVALTARDGKCNSNQHFSQKDNVLAGKSDMYILLLKDSEIWAVLDT